MVTAFPVSKELARLVSFARWCSEYNVEPCEAAELIRLARRAYAAGERGTGLENNKAEVRAGKRFEDFAWSLGFQTDWPGLWPILRRNGRDIHLPE